MTRAFELPENSKCGLCKSKIKDGDIFTIIYEDDDSGNIKYLLCDNCEVDDYIQHYRDTGMVDSRLSMDATLANYHFRESDNPEASINRLRDDVRHYYKKYKKDLLEIADSQADVYKAIADFENKHWLSYLKKYWNDTQLRGHEAMVGDIKLMMWGCAGRVLITAERNKQDITMIFSDEEGSTSRGGQQGIHATQAEALNLIKTLIEAKKIKFHPQKEVTLAGL